MGRKFKDGDKIKFANGRLGEVFGDKISFGMSYIKLNKYDADLQIKRNGNLDIQVIHNSNDELIWHRQSNNRFVVSEADLYIIINKLKKLYNTDKTSEYLEWKKLVDKFKRY